MTEVIIVGGSYSGMAAALQLVRGRRRVMILDAGQRRNRFASHAHGFLTQDGTDPAEIAAIARAQLERYRPDIFYPATAAHITGLKGNFDVITDDGVPFNAPRVILATGVSDTLPDVPGLAERWGRSVFHCPYCHGYELNQGNIGFLANGPEGIEHSALFQEFGQPTFLSNGQFPIDRATWKQLASYGNTIEERRITGLHGPLGGPIEMRFVHGAPKMLNGLFVMPKTRPSSDVGVSIGVALEETPFGAFYRTDALKETSVPGIFACGDAGRAQQSISFAVADGAMAGVAAHRSLIFDPHR